jgi:hypothetical protein
MFLVDIFEARKNPDLNPKVSVNQYIDQAMTTAGKLPGTDITNLFVSFTELPKLGINPRSKYNTPLGIYSYPADYVVASTHGRYSMATLPFAGKQPYANIFQGRGNIVNLQTMTLQDEYRYNDKLRAYAKRLPAVDFTKRYAPPGKDWPDIVNRTINAAVDYAKERMLSGGRLWYTTWKLSGYMETYLKRPATLAWNELFRQVLGIDGCVDTGKGIIHPSEPVQAVFFSLAATKLISTVPNKYSPEQISAGEERGYKMKEQLERLRDALEKQDYETIMWQILQDSSIDGYTFDSKYLMKYIPKDVRYLLYKNYKWRASLVFDLGKALKADEMLYALSENPKLFTFYGAVRLPGKLIFDNLDAIMKILQDYKSNVGKRKLEPGEKRVFITDIKDIVSTLFKKFPKDDPEFLKGLVDLYPGVYESFYNTWGLGGGRKYIYQYALKKMKEDIKHFDQDDIDGLLGIIESLNYQEYLDKERKSK